MTAWLSKWHTENASNVNIFGIEHFLLDKERSMILILDYIKQTKYVSEWVCDWTTDEQHVHKGVSLLKSGLLVPSPFNGAEADCAHDVEYDGNEELPVQLDEGRIPEGGGGGRRLHELEDGKGGHRVLLEGTAQNGIDLKQMLKRKSSIQRG